MAAPSTVYMVYQLKLQERFELICSFFNQRKKKLIDKIDCIIKNLHVYYL